MWPLGGGASRAFAVSPASKTTWRNAVTSLLTGIAVDNRPGRPVISADAKDENFHAAIFGNDDDAMPDMTADDRASPAVHSSRRRGDAGPQVAHAAQEHSHTIISCNSPLIIRRPLSSRARCRGDG
jgi:hypothetical protein